MVVAYPALRRARELFPDATLHFLCFGQVRSSLEMLNVIAPEDIHTIDSGSFTSLVRDTMRTWSVARRAGIDTVVNLETFVRYSSLLSYLTGAARRVGFHRFTQEGLYTGDFLTHKVMYNPHIHTAHVFLDLVQALVAPPGGIPIVKRPRAGDDLSIPRLVTDETTAAAIWSKLAALHPRHQRVEQARGTQPEREQAVSDAAAAPGFICGARAPRARRSRRLRAGHRRRRREAGCGAHLVRGPTRRESWTSRVRPR